MKRPRKAFLLAAGYGTRMQPLSDDLPKPMMPIWGQPAIARIIDLLETWGVKEIVVNLHHNPGPVLDFLKKRSRQGIRIDVSFEPEIMGTGGALRKAEPFLSCSDPFWVVNTDIAVDLSPLPFLREMEKKKALSVLWLHSEKGPRTVEMKGSKITDFSSADPGSSGTYTFCGLQLVRPDLFKYVHDKSVFTIIEAYKRAMADKKRISGVVVKNSFWADFGTPDQYLDAHKDILIQYKKKKAGARLFDPAQLSAVRVLRKKGVDISGFVSVGENVNVAAGSKIRDSVLLDNSRIRRGVELNRSIVGRGVALSGDANGVVVRAANVDDKVLNSVLRQLRLQKESTLVAPISGGRGSARSFTRLVSNDQSLVLVRYSDERRENKLFAGHAVFLKKMRVNVPRIICDIPESNTVLVEDLGDNSLESMSKGMTLIEKEKVYQSVLKQLRIFHNISLKEVKKTKLVLEQPFRKDLYRWERELMGWHFLSGRLGLGQKCIKSILEDVEIVSEKLLKLPDVLLHRDMQSSNVLFSGSIEKPFFIDFQGMRLGPAVYDLASLLCDPYIMLPEKMQLDLLDFYISISKSSDSTRDFFWYAAVERLVQALGAFGRLSAIPATKRFEQHIEPALVMLKRALVHIDGLETLKRFVNGRLG